MKLETAEAGDEVYSQDGRCGVYIARIGGKHVVTPVFDVEDGETESGESELWGAIYLDPPTPKLHKDAKHLEERVAELDTRRKNLTQQISAAQQELVQTETSLRQVKEEMPDTFKKILAVARAAEQQGSYLIVCAREYGWIRGVTLEPVNSCAGTTLLSLTVDRNYRVEWNTIPVYASKQDALNALPTYLLELVGLDKKDDWKNADNILKIYAAYRLTPSEELVAGVKDRKERILRQEIASAETEIRQQQERINKAQKALETL